MFRQCRLPQPFSNPSFEWRIISFSIEAISNFNALPLQARLGLLFLFLPFFCLPVLSPAWMGLVFSHPGSPLFWIRSQLAHTAPTGPVWGFPGVVSLAGPQNRTQATQGRVWFHRLFFPAFLGGSPANSRYAYTTISPALNPRMKISLGRKDPPCRGFLLQVLLIFSAGLLPIFRIPFCEAFSLFTPPQILRRPIPRFWVSKRPGAILALA